MADTLQTKKVTDLAENTAMSDEDLFMVGSAGTASLRKLKWSNIWNTIKTAILGKLVANNLTTTAAGYLLDARQGKALDDKISKLNTEITHVMMPDYSKQVQVTSPYTAESDGWLQCNLRSQGGLSTLRLDGSTAFAIGQTISSSSYTTNFITVPIAKGQTAVVDGIVASIYFVPCIGI